MTLFWNGKPPDGIRFMIAKRIWEVMEVTIEKKTDGDKLEVVLSGRLDTTTAPELETELKQAVGGIAELVFDFEKLEYISSAGLRVLLSMQKIMNKQGDMVIRNVNEIIREVFEVTGFIDILAIE